jgi:MYXO-CTERM domain-containing protein
MTLIAALLLGISGPGYAAPDGTDITIEVTTDASGYLLGEPVGVRVEYCNPTSEAITVRLGCPRCGIRLLTVDEGGNEADALILGGGIQVVVNVVWAPGECTSREYTWDQMGPWPGDEQVPAGSYSMRYIWDVPPFPGFPTFTTVADSEPFVLGGVTVVPTLAPWSVLALALALGLLGLGLLRRRRSLQPD